MLSSVAEAQHVQSMGRTDSYSTSHEDIRQL